MAKISTIKEAIRLCREAGITPFIWGHRGLGKSSLVQQECAANNWGFIDLRCSQLEASDIRGLPNPGEDGRTHYLPPADMPIGDQTPEVIGKELGNPPKEGDMEAERQFYLKLANKQRHFQEGILFIDEVNRAQDDVLQAIFQLVLDRKVGQYVLPPGWNVVAAGNYAEGSYQVSGFNDAAFLNRFCHMDLSAGETTLEEWVDYMSLVHAGNASDVVEFATQNMKHLDGDVQGERGFSVQPSRRSWEMVVKAQLAYKKHNFNESTYHEVLSGLIGRDLAQTFARHSCPVKPKELLSRGVKAFETQLKALNRNQLVGLMWGLVSYCKNQIEDDKIATVCLDFAEFMVKHANDKDVVVAFCRALVSGGNSNDHQTKARAAVISNPRLAQMVARFNKRTGDKKTFVERLSERPSLQAALSKVSWGVDESEE